MEKKITFFKFTIFTETIMHLVYPSNFAQPLCLISLGIAVMPRRN